MPDKPENNETFFFSLREARRLDPTYQGGRDPSYPDSIQSAPLAPVFPRLAEGNGRRLLARLPSLLDPPKIHTVPEPEDPVALARAAAPEQPAPIEPAPPPRPPSIDPHAVTEIVRPPLGEPPTTTASPVEPPPAQVTTAPAAPPVRRDVHVVDASARSIVPSVAYFKPKRWPWVVAGLLTLAAVVALVATFLAGPRARATAKQGRAAASVGAPATPPASTAITLATSTATSASSATTTVTTNANANATTATTTIASLGTTTATATTNAASTATTTAPAVAATGSATNGTIRTTASANGHRVFIDGKMAGQGARTFAVKCGKHSVRIGGAGPAKDVDVPCGGEVLVH